MRIGSDPWCELIAAGSTDLGIAISTGQIMQFARHAELLVAWNHKINLTAITEPEQIAIKHYLDVLAALPHIPEDVELLDIGTGGGFPGIPLKIMRPSQPMILIDSIRKKISFIKEVIRSLTLDRIQAIHIRAEELAQQDAQRNRYGVVISRAVAHLPAIVRIAEPLLAPDGRIIALKGPKSGSASSQGPSEHYPAGPRFRCDGFDYRLPVSGASRTLIVITHQS